MGEYCSQKCFAHNWKISKSLFFQIKEIKNTFFMKSFKALKFKRYLELEFFSKHCLIQLNVTSNYLPNLKLFSELENYDLISWNRRSKKMLYPSKLLKIKKNASS